MKIEDVGKIKGLIESIEYIDREREKVKHLNCFSVYDEDDRAIILLTDLQLKFLWKN